MKVALVLTLCIIGCMSAATGPLCPDGSHIVYCFVDPCMMAKCPAHPNTICKANYCGGCNYDFYNRHGDKLSKEMCQVS